MDSVSHGRGVLGDVDGRGTGEAGFTVLELMIVLATMATVIVLAIPTFKQGIKTVKDHVAQANLRTAYKVGKTAFYDQYSFDNATAAALAGQEPSLTFANGGNGITNNNKTIFVTTASGANWLAIDYSASGTYYGLAVTAGQGIGRCKTSSLATAQAWTVANCTAPS